MLPCIEDHPFKEVLVSISGNHLELGNALVWVALKAEPETRSWVQVVNLGGERRKQE